MQERKKNRSLPIQKYLSGGNFRDCVSSKRVFTEKVVRISLGSV